MILVVLSYFYLGYEHIDPFIYIIHLIPVSMALAVLFEGFIPGICTWLAFNMGSYMLLDNELLPTLLSSTCMLIFGLWLHKKYIKKFFLIKCIYSSILISIYAAVLITLVPAHMRENPMNIVYALIGTYLTSWFVSFLYLNVKRQEIVKEKLINAEKYQLIGSLAASISHEIRNPLTTSRGFLQMLNRRSTKAEEVKRFASLALEGIDQANTIITDYLNFAKPNVNKMEQIELKSEITSIIPFINSLAHFSNVDITINHITEQPLYVWGESKRMHQCLLNLIKNSIESMPQGGTLTIETALHNDIIEVRIIDTGYGMTREQIKSLGLPFYTTKEKGTGLGLMVVISLLKLMNARISFTSKVNIGTTCSIRFKSLSKEG